MLTAQPAAARGREAAPGFAQLRDVIRHGRPHTGLIAFAILVSLVEIAATLWYPILTKELIDGLQSSGVSSGGIVDNPQVRLLVLILAAGAAAGGLSTYLLMKAGLRMSASLKSRLVSALLAKPVPYFDQRESGEHVSRVANDSTAISKLVTSEVRGLVTGVLLLIGSAIVLMNLDFELTLVIFGIILAAFVLLAPVFLAIAGITRRINDATAALGSSLTRIFSEIRLVKAFTAEAAEQARSEQAIGDLYASSLRSARIEAALQPVMSLALTFALLAIFTYGGARVALGTLSVGTLTAFILYIFNIVAPLIQLSSFASSLQAAKGASGRIHDILFSPAESAAPAPAAALPVPAMDDEARDLTFSGVRLTYAGAERPALEIEDLTFPAGTSTAVIGPSGSGKTSLLSLIERFYDPTEGTIRWGGEPIERIPLGLWRARLGYVAQTAPLMTGTIADNIAYGSPGPPDRERMEQAAASANCLDFIARLEQGLDSQVGEAGVRLSGGQRQRLAIARIFMRDPSLLLLDEATSNLDVESEDAVRGALRRLMAGRTTIVVTHRLSMLSDVDFLAIVEDGRLVDFGPRAEIVAQSPYYRRVTRLLSD